MKAVIMAGGSGTRLRPLTCNLPKPMVPVANKPMSEHIVNLLKKHNFKDIIFTLHYLQDAFLDVLFYFVFVAAGSLHCVPLALSVCFDESHCL